MPWKAGKKTADKALKEVIKLSDKFGDRVILLVFGKVVVKALSELGIKLDCK